MRTISAVAAISLLLAVFAFVGHMDHEDEKAAQVQYCEMVKAGHWPDYQGTYRRECLRPSPAPR